LPPCYLEGMLLSLGRRSVRARPGTRSSALSQVVVASLAKIARTSHSAALVISLLVLVSSPRPASAFCRTTTQPLPANYSPNRGCFTDGLFLYWRNACVSYSINLAASRNISFADATRVIDASFATWMSTTCTASGAPPGISVSNIGPSECGEVRYNPETPNQNLIVFRDDSWPYQDPNSTLGLTTVTFNAESGEIYDADMEINSSQRNLSVSDQVPANGFDLASVITHEAGHFLGLAHATDNRSTMFASYKPGTIALRSLSADDVAGLCAIYPSASERIVSPTTVQPTVISAGTCDAAPRHGFTTKCVTPKAPAEERCSVMPGRTSVPGSTAVLLAVATALLVLRRSGARERGAKRRLPNA
jgi:hypothetical protein